MESRPEQNWGRGVFVAIGSEQKQKLTQLCGNRGRLVRISAAYMFLSFPRSVCKAGSGAVLVWRSG